MIITPRFLDELREKITLSDLIGKKVKLTARGHEFTGLCPFHNEKTPSFTINDDKGFYHCFGCGAHGDAVTYMINAEKMPFPEAVEYLAHMVGMPMPKDSPKQIEESKKHAALSEIMETACQFFQEHLFGTTGKKARDYLMARGISGHVAKTFRLGYAPSGSTLTARLQAKGYNIEDCISLGLVVRNKVKGQLHDYFYDRVMFPILDRRKKVIGFGGRIMEKGEPKYLNSPETALFHKGEQLYALPHAIETIRKKNEAILVEGYMDVIALHSSGFTNAVAPLGTALTENQIQLLWKNCDEPIICFDGDNAGRRAGIRALKRALPILTPGKSLRFAWLPDTFDPDDMIRKKSPQEFAKVIAGAQAMTGALWNTLLEGRMLDTPERLAKLRQDALESVKVIQDETVRGYYVKDLKNRLWKLDTKGKNKRTPFHSVPPITIPAPGTLEARMMISYLICYPQTAQKILEDISSLNLKEQILNNALHQISDLIYENPDITGDEIEQKLSHDILHALAGEIEMLKKSHRSERQVTNELRVWLQNARIKALEADVNEKMKEYERHPSPEIWKQIFELKKDIENLKESE